MQALLAQTTAMLEGAISDVTVGIGSDFGYQAIFKSQANVAYVKAVLQKMAGGGSMPLDSNNVASSRSPVFVCAPPNDNTPAMRQFTSKCTGLSPAALIPYTPFVVLCPSFFRMKEAPETGNCPMMAPRGGGLMNPFAIIANQRSAMVQQLAHFYLGSDDLQPEVTGLDDIFLLSEDTSKRNARSYDFYVASKIPPLFAHHPFSVG